MAARPRYLPSDQCRVWLAMTEAAAEPEREGWVNLPFHPDFLLIPETPASLLSLLLQHTRRKCLTYADRSGILSLSVSEREGWGRSVWVKNTQFTSSGWNSVALVGSLRQILVWPLTGDILCNCYEAV